jgi:ribosome-associated toxin RatA of RatAB toxin-antitoxin module
VLANGAPAAEDVSVEVERRGEGMEVRAKAFVAAGVPLVWKVVTDYERLPRFVPGIARSVVRQRSENRLRLDQAGEARFLVFSFPIEVQLEVVEAPPHWVVSHAVSGNLRRMIGRYDLRPDGVRGGLVLAYTGFIEPAFDLPPLVGAAALRQMVEEQFRAMVAEIERRAAER